MQTPVRGVTSRRDRAAATDRKFLTLSLLIVAMVFLGKLGLNIGDGSVGLDAFILWFGLAYLVLTGEIEIVPGRFVLLLLLIAAMLLAMMLTMVSASGQSRFTAAAIIIFMYAGFVLRINVSREFVSRCFRVFQTCMVVIACIVIMQQLLQYTVGNWAWPNLEKIVPTQLLYPGFAYLRPYFWHSPYLEPNAIFFLEPSQVSLYLAMACVLELTWFHDFKRLCLFGAAMLACLAGTGPVSLMLTAPFWIFRISPRLRLSLLVVGVPVLLVVLATGWLDSAVARTGDLSQSNSSGYARVVLPLRDIAQQLANQNLVSGWGAGSSLRVLDLVQWPFSKLLFEYGLLTAVLFHAYLFLSLFSRPPSLPLLMVMLVPYLIFGGGFVAHTDVMPLLLFGSLMRVEPQVEKSFASFSKRSAVLF